MEKDATLGELGGASVAAPRGLSAYPKELYVRRPPAASPMGSKAATGTVLTCWSNWWDRSVLTPVVYYASKHRKTGAYIVDE